MFCDANGVPLRFLPSGGQASDISYAQPLLDEAYIPSLRGRETAFALYGEHCLTISATSLFALPEAEAFLKALQRKKLIIQRDIERDTFYRARRRSELNAMIEHHSQTQTS